VPTGEKTSARAGWVAGPVPAARARLARRRWRGRLGRWRAGLLALGAAVVVVAAGWLLGWSDLLAVDQVRVAGARVLSDREVARAAAVRTGTPLARVDLEATAARVRELAAVADVEVSRDWPGTVSIEVVERQPMAVLQEGAEFRALDAAGVVFRSYATPPDRLPLVRADQLAGAGSGSPEVVRAEALREVAAVVEALDARVAEGVEHVEVASLDAITLVLHEGAVVQWGSAEDSALKAEVLAALMQVPAATYDVSVPQLPTTSG